MSWSLMGVKGSIWCGFKYRFDCILELNVPGYLIVSNACLDLYQYVITLSAYFLH